GAKAVSELLFNAELASGAGGRQWASAGHGYIVGVFAPASGGELDAYEVEPGDDDGELFGVAGRPDAPLTVWVRVNQEAPHLEIRWREGVRLAAAASEAERVARADEIWASLPRSAGRRDVVARDLTKVLYGDRVRCVSFLSTSVRSKVATNLLSQPLNEISPERVFEAIAALTGLDAELEQERQARRDEHAKRVRAAQAAERLAEFEAESRALLTTFDRRDQARVRLAEAMRAWKGRQARKLADAAAKDDAHDADRAVAENTADELRGRIPALEEARRFADGRDVPGAERELREARLRLNEALKALGVADQEVASARAALDDAEGGPAAAQLDA